MKYLKKFEQKALYESFVSNSPILPNVSYTVDTNEVFYNPYVLQIPQIDLTGIENGIYAVTSDYRLVTEEEADETCIAVAVINNFQKIMLAKYSSKETGSILGLEDKFIWGPSNLVEGMPICSNENSAFLDFNGKSSTELLINIAGEDTTHMGTYCALFNQNSEVNCGFSDWYIPSFGQLNVFLENYSVRTMFDIIGGSIPESSGYHSSTQYSETRAWGIDLYERFTLTNPKNASSFVHLVRDLEITDNSNYVIFGVSSPDGGFPYMYKVENGTTWEQLSKINDRFIIDDQGNVIFRYYPFYDNVKSGDIITSKIYSLELD